MKIELFSHKSPALDVEVIAKIKDDGDLVIEGYDIGDMVCELMDDSDYEYFLTIEKSKKQDLLNILEHPVFMNNPTEDMQLLLAIQHKFSGNNAFTQIRDFLKANDIPFSEFYWR